MPGGRPSKLTPEIVEAARANARTGLPVTLIANEIGIHHATCSRWLREAETSEPGSLLDQFRQAIFSADAENCRSLMSSLKRQADDGNAWAASWLLTHHPRLRNHFSDAAADRRVERRTMAVVVDAITAAKLPDDQERLLLLQLQARGLGAAQDDGDAGS